MPRKLKLYLDTSVPNAYFDKKNPNRREITRRFWPKLSEYQVFISDLVIKEIKAAKEEKLRDELINLIEDFESLSTKNEEIKTLIENKPVWQHHCEMCLACVEWCPKKAIHHCWRVEGKDYHHPDVKISDMFRQNQYT